MHGVGSHAYGQSVNWLTAAANDVIRVFGRENALFCLIRGSVRDLGVEIAGLRIAQGVLTHVFQKHSLIKDWIATCSVCFYSY